MNQLRHANGSDGRFCSPPELITATNGIIGKGQMLKAENNPNSPAVVLGMASKPAKPAVNGNGGNSADNGAADGARRIEQSIAYMREHLHQPMPVAKLAALANISPSHFFALFKRQTGSSPMDYFTHLRMQHACRLLDQTSTSVKEVAAVLGYDDPFYFSRVFKAVNRIPPSRYRALQEQPASVFRSDKVGTAEGGRGINGNGAVAVSLPGNGKHQNSRIVHSLQEKTEI